MSNDLSGFSMFDLFRAEAETHAAALSEGLLAIEADPTDLSHVDKLMRAAHSLKGAARIIGLDSVVELAHTMEDCFLSVQKGSERLTSARVDQLLRGVDVFQQLAGLPEDQLDAWLKSGDADCTQLAESLRQPVVEGATEGVSDDKPSAPAASAAGEEPTTAMAPPDGPIAEEPESPPAGSAATPAETSMVATPSAGPTIETDEAEAQEPAAEDRVVPVGAGHLNRIMRLASESMVDARRLQAMQQSLSQMRDSQRRFSELLDRFGESGIQTDRTASLDELRGLNRKSEQLLQDHGTRLERTLWRSERTATALYHEVIGSRMRPFVEGTQAFPRMIRDLARKLAKRVSFQVLGGSVAVDRDILRKLEAPLNHLLRNCVDHGIETARQRQSAGKPETGTIVLEARHHAGMLTIEVRDDGGGIDPERLRSKIVQRKLVDDAMAADMTDDELFEFLFLPGFSTAGEVTEVSGRGVGLDVVRSMVQEVSGTVRVESRPQQGTTFSLRLPVTLSVIRAALAEIAGETYAFPLAKLVRIVRVPVDEIRPVQGRQQFTLDDTSVGLVRGSEILDLPGTTTGDDTVSVMVIGQDQQPCGIAVDRFIGEQDLVVRPLDRRLGKVPHISAAALTEAGEPLLIVDIDDMLQSIRQLLGEGRLRGMMSVAEHQGKRRRKVLVVDDSITVREVERQLLTTCGYDVQVAVDGQDAWHALRAEPFDLLITDVDMPRMDGIQLIQTVRNDTRFEELPIVIISYKDREEDRIRGFEAGANAYLTKGSFHDDSFVKTVADLIGESD
jgi:two-component system sensor histidine kinase and response regulator WspE